MAATPSNGRDSDLMADDDDSSPRTTGDETENDMMMSNGANDRSDRPQKHVDNVEAVTVAAIDVAAVAADESEAGALMQPSKSLGPASEVHVPVEAFGSGVLLHSGIAVTTDKTVGDLRKLLLSSVVCSPRTRTFRLFVGHGGIELQDDALLIAASPIPKDVDQPLVALPILCTYPRSCASGDSTWAPNLQRLDKFSLSVYGGRERSRRSCQLWVAQCTTRSGCATGNQYSRAGSGVWRLWIDRLVRWHGFAP